MQADRQAESVKGEPRFRRRPRRRPVSASCWLERWAGRPLSPPTCATVRLASQTPIASNGSRLTASSPYASSSSPLSSPSWPSSPYCPPSHDEMAISKQCNRESSALRSDYYSSTQKTANPLNERWTTMERRGARSALRSIIGARALRVTAFAARRDRIFRGIKEITVRQAFLRCERRRAANARGVSASAIHRAPTRYSDRRSDVDLAKKFSTGRVDRAMRGRKIASRRANQCR